jgi:hypothetical protein
MSLHKGYKIEKLDIAQKDLWNNPKYIPSEDYEEDPLVLCTERTSIYTPDQKRTLVASYLACGNLKKAANIAGMEWNDAKQFKKQAAWFPELVKEIKKSKQEELDAKMTEIIHLGINALFDRVLNGDSIMNHRTGEVILRPIAALDLAKVVSILFDKRALIRGDPTTRSERVTTEATLKMIMERMESVAKNLNTEKTISSDVIEGELEE